MKIHKIGIIMNGVTGRMGTRQHLLRSINAIIEEGGIAVSPDEVIMPDAIFVGRNENKLKHLTEISHVKEYTTDLDSVLSDDRFSVYFDSQGTLQRFDAVKKSGGPWQTYLLREAHRYHHRPGLRVV
jgi:hypothetical protein